ncbi:MAG: apolipoprotein N-acyltransferase [Bacteroidales bacterium]|nr:apolipoprotein N-acyltransferase [Bacteroidales bacterium]
MKGMLSFEPETENRMKHRHLLLLSLLSGLLLATAWPEKGFTPLVFVALVPLFFVQQHLGNQNKRGMFWYAWLAFLVWNVLTTWWIWYSTDVGAILAFVLNAMFSATVFYLFHLSKKKLFDNKKGWAILVFYWITWEYFHMNWELTWSWLNLGNVFASQYKWIQWYEYTGALGGTLWVIVINIFAFRVVSFLLKKDFGRRFRLAVSGMVVLTVLPVAYSYYMYSNYREVENPVEVVVVQPNTDPYNEQYNYSPLVLLEKNLSLAAQKITDSTRFVVFPESTLYDGNQGIWEDRLSRSPLLKRLQEFIDEHPKITLVIGASTHRELKPAEKKTHAARKFSTVDRYYYAYNTAFQMDSSANIQIHHKSKLTPGVENMPSWGILKPIENLAIDLGGTTGSLKTEDVPVIFTDAKNVRTSAIICYESVYGEFTAETIRKGAGLIFVVTNDGWWGDTPGYRQHFLFSVLRAIETRRSIARSANTGISAFINQRGDVFQKTGWWVPAVIRQKINVNDKLTYYVKNGDYIARISAFLAALLFIISFVQGFLKRKKIV